MTFQCCWQLAIATEKMFSIVVYQHTAEIHIINLASCNVFSFLKLCYPLFKVLHSRTPDPTARNNPSTRLKLIRNPFTIIIKDRKCELFK